MRGGMRRDLSTKFDVASFGAYALYTAALIVGIPALVPSVLVPMVLLVSIVSLIAAVSLLRENLRSFDESRMLVRRIRLRIVPALSAFVPVALLSMYWNTINEMLAVLFASGGFLLAIAAWWASDALVDAFHDRQLRVTDADEKAPD